MKRVTRADIERLSLENPTVRACIEAQRGHGVKWDDALMAMVWYLYEDLQAQRAITVRLLERMPAEGITMEGGVSDVQVRRACDECHEVREWLSVTNKGRCVCDRCSADWVVDLIGNVLIEPTGIGSGTGEGDVLYG